MGAGVPRDTGLRRNQNTPANRQGSRIWSQPTVIMEKSRPGPATWPESIPGELAFHFDGYVELEGWIPAFAGKTVGGGGMPAGTKIVSSWRIERPWPISQGLFILVSLGHPVLFCHSEQSEESKVLANIAFLRYSDEVPDEGFQILRFAQNDIC